MPARRSVVLVTLLCSATAMLGCTTWSRPTVNLHEAVARNRARLQLTLMDGQIVRLSHHPMLRGDSIAEQQDSTSSRCWDSVRCRWGDTTPRVFATRDVRLIQTRELSAARTGLLIVGIPAAVYFALVSYACRGGRDC